MSQPSKNNGFTLIEVLAATLLIGIAITALMAANAGYTRVNGVGADITTAEFLLEQIRELTMTLAVIDPQSGVTTFGPEETGVVNFDDLDDFDGATLSPPIDASGNSLTDFSQYTQVVEVNNVSPTNFEQIVNHHSSRFVRVRVAVSKNGQVINQASWIRTRPN